MITNTKYIINKTNILELAMNVYSHFECRKYIVASNKVVQNQDFTIKLYTNIVSEKLLELAIKIRILLYQGHEFNPKNIDMLIGSYEEMTENRESSTWEYKTFTINDICDKIIHANDILIVSGIDSNREFVLRDDIELIGNKQVRGKSVRWIMHLKPNCLYEYLATCLKG